MKIKNALIIHGPGKSGTTFLHDLLALHEDLYWISTYLNKYPKQIWLSVFNNIQAIDIVESRIRNRSKFPKPAESFPFLSHYAPNFLKDSSNLDPIAISNLQNAILGINKYQAGNRFITKLTGPSQFRLIDEVFEDPFIIWIDRDPKSIIASYYKYRWNYKDSPELFKKKTKMELIAQYAKYYKWIHSEKENLKKFRFKMVHYEDLTKDPERFFKELLEFLQLAFTDNFKNKIRSWDIRKNTNEKYKEIFNEKELHYLTQELDTKKR